MEVARWLGPRSPPSSPTAWAPPHSLTASSRCLGLAGEGNSNKQIAAALFIAEGTVKSHLTTILGKLDAADRTQAVTIALRRGLLRLE